MASSKGRIWTVVMLTIILVLPLIALLLLRQGFETRRDAPHSSRLLANDLVNIPAYNGISFRGDTITSRRMQGKVTVLHFTSASCVPVIDSLMRSLYEIQADYYGKTLSLRIITNTLEPEKDDANDMRLLSERYAGREIWHFIRATDSSGIRLFNWCLAESKIFNTGMETDLNCPQLVFLTDGDGKFRGAYDLRQKQQFHDLYNDILYLVNKLDLHE